MNPRDPDGEAGHELPAYSEHSESGPKQEIAAYRLRRSISAAIVAVAYCGLLLFSWIVTAISTQRPLFLPGYTAEELSGYRFAAELERLYRKSQRYFGAAQVIGSLTHLLTIPVISTVVAAALAVHLQRDISRSYTLRQMLMLADKNWNSPLKMLAALGNPQGHYSWFLWAATILNILVPSRLSSLGQFPIIDLDPLLNERDDTGVMAESVTSDIRAKLLSADRNEVQPHLWYRRNRHCHLKERAAGVVQYSGGTRCAKRELTFQAIDELSEEYYGISELFTVALPSGFSSGTLSQHAPGMQPTVSVTRTALPDECTSDADNAFYVEYRSTEGAERNWTITACMLEDSRDLIQPTRGRQTVRETAYFSFDFPGSRWEDDDDPPVVEVTTETIVGYLELPNYANYDEPGPFEDTDPGGISSMRRRDLDRSEGPNQLSFRDTVSKGPLGYFTAALFGHGSYIHMQNYTDSMPIYTDNAGRIDRTLIGRRPLQGLLSSTSGSGECGMYIHDAELLSNSANELSCIAGAFLDNANDTKRMMHAGLLLAAESFLTYPFASFTSEMYISSDRGLDYVRPTMSKAGLAAISVLVGILAASLLGLSLYAATQRSWTPSLDALTLLRIGAEIGPAQLPLLVTKRPLDVHELDRLRVSVGDKSPSPPAPPPEDGREARAVVGTLSALGGARIDTRKKFLACRSRYDAPPNKAAPVRRPPPPRLTEG